MRYALALRRLMAPAWFTRLRGHMSPTERLVAAWLTVAIIVSGIASLTAYIRRHTELLPQAGGTYTEAAVGQPRYLNPILAGASDLDVDITRLVFSSLFQMDENLQLTNDLATAHEISADQKTYTITLRPDVVWHDGQPLTARDVVFTIRSIQTPDYGSPLQNAFQGVEVEAVDDHTVRFVLTQPYAPFLSSLTVGIVPEHVWSAIAPKNASLAEHMLKPVGSGPFRFAEIATRRKTGDITTLRLARHDAYHGPRPYVDEIVFTFVPSHEEAVQALAAGHIEGIGFVPLPLRERLNHRTVTHRLLLPQYFALFFNQHQSAILGDAGVRNALAQATDRAALAAEALQGEGEPLHVPIPHGVFAHNTDLGLSPYQPTVAQQNLEEAGWKDIDGDGIREKDDQRLAFTITTTDWPEYVRTAELVRDQWRTIGVEARINPVGAGSIQQTIIRPRDYEVLLFGEILPPDPDPYPFWHSTQTRSPGLNFSLFKNDEVDKLLEEGRKTTDPVARAEKYQAFQGKILELNPAIILYRPYYLFATHRSVRGVTAGAAALPADRFNTIEQWHVNVRRVWKRSGGSALP